MFTFVPINTHAAYLSLVFPRKARQLLEILRHTFSTYKRKWKSGVESSQRTHVGRRPSSQLGVCFVNIGRISKNIHRAVTEGHFGLHLADARIATILLTPRPAP